MGFFTPFEMPGGASIPDLEVNLPDYGGVEGGAVKNTQAIRAAIDDLAARGGGRLTIPAGKWLTGPIHFKSGVELHLEKGCEVIFSTDKADYLPAVFTLYEGMRCYTWSAQLYACGCHDIAVTGEGTFNGQGFVWWYMVAVYPQGLLELHDRCEAGDPVEARVYDKVEQGLRPGLLHFVDCKNVTIEGCTFTFSPFWTLHPAWCENIIVRNITVRNPYAHAPNTDGCNLEGCRRALVDGVFADTGDDAVCLKAGRDADGRAQMRPCEDVVLRNIIASRSHGGITIGSEMSSGVRNIYVEDCEFRNNFIGIWIKTAPERGGYVRDVEFHNIRTGKLRQQALCATMGYYVDDYKPGAYANLPVIENILVDGLDSEYAGTAIQLEGCRDQPLRNIVLKHVRVDGKELLRVSQVEGLKMEDVNLRGR